MECVFVINVTIVNVFVPTTCSWVQRAITIVTCFGRVEILHKNVVELLFRNMEHLMNTRHMAVDAIHVKKRQDYINRNGVLLPHEPD